MLSFNSPTWRLGNQMFQYAALLGVANKIKTSAVFNIESTYLDKCFKLGTGTNGMGSPDGVFQEPSFEFCPAFFEIDPNIKGDLQGYFQTEKYFKHIEDVIRKEFTFKDYIRKEAKSYFDDLSTKKPTVSIHVRRGDYVEKQAYHTNQQISYYEKALLHFPDHVPVVFSDDISWCKDNLNGLSETVLFSENDPVDGTDGVYIDLCRMSMCDSHIIVNSSYSWWAAWLSQRKTVAPSQWFGPQAGNLNWKDIYCKDWIII
jgi:hypothetical protein